MGSELNKLKALYGVSTPTIAAYTGATNPGAAAASTVACFPRLRRLIAALVVTQ